MNFKFIFCFTLGLVLAGCDTYQQTGTTASGEKLYTAGFKINVKQFERLEKEGGFGLTAINNYGSSSNGVPYSGPLTYDPKYEFFKNYGVSLNVPTEGVYFNDRRSEIYVRATLPKIKKIKSILQNLKK